MREAWQLKQKQGLPLELKIRMTKTRIRQFYDHYIGNVYVSFSGGKDSTVMLDLVRSLYPNVPAVFCDTGLEYPEIREFVRTIDNVTWLKPKMNFKETLEKYGYPVVTKEQAKYIREMQNGTTKYTYYKRLHGKGKYRAGMISKKWQYLINAPFKISEKCCDVMKKRPAHQYFRDTGRYPFIGTMAGDSSFRKQSYIKYGCNAYDTKKPMSRPLMVWKEEDVWEYIRTKKIPYCNIYDTGVQNTGCMFCMFGVHLDPKPNRFQLMKKTHPKLYDYCMEKLGCRKILKHLKVAYE